MDTPKINLTLAKKHLVGWPSKQVLNDECRELYQRLQEAARLHTAWGLAGALENNSEWGPLVNDANDAFNAARKALTVIAGVNVLCNTSGKDQKTKATALLGKKELMPKALFAALEKVA